MADNGNQQETIRCSRCKKNFFADGFKVNRLGRRLKTCIECCASRNASSECNKCPHGRTRNMCRECGGASICEHNRRRRQCRECGGSSICEHGHLRAHCWSCDPAGALWKRAKNRIGMAIGTKARAGRSTADLLGCDKATFYHHIEALFKDGMCWARISEIDIDHRMPIGYKGVAGGSPTLEEKVARLDYRNCQPLWAADNMAKGNRWADPPAEKPPALTLTDDELAELIGF